MSIQFGLQQLFIPKGEPYVTESWGMVTQWKNIAARWASLRPNYRLFESGP